MRLFTQHGYQGGPPLDACLKHSVIDGIMFSPKDAAPDTLDSLIKKARVNHVGSCLIDPQRYSWGFVGNPQESFGTLFNYPGFRPHANHANGNENIQDVIAASLAEQQKHDASALVAPNVIIFKKQEKAADKEAIKYFEIAGQFQAQTHLDIYATLAIDRELLGNIDYVNDLLDCLTALKHRPIGVYLLFNTDKGSGTLDLYRAELVRGQLRMADSLGLNGFKTAIGYVEHMAPLFAAIGVHTCCLGRTTSMRKFSQARFTKSEGGGGGKPKVQWYRSNAIYGALRASDLQKVRHKVPAVLNNAPSDHFFPENKGATPIGKHDDYIQLLSAIKIQCNEISAIGDKQATLEFCDKRLGDAENVVRVLCSDFDYPTINLSRIKGMREGLRLFAANSNITIS